MGNDKVHFNFPIVLLEGFLKDSRESLNNIFDYAMYTKTLDYEHGDEIEMLKSAEKFFGVKSGNKSNAYENGEELYNSTFGTPKTRIAKEVYFEYYRGEKSEFEKVVLLAHLALLSTNKGKPYTKVGKHYLYSRMDGKIKSLASSFKDEKLTFPDPKVTEQLSDNIRKYATHRYWQRIKKELINKWYWVIPSKRPVMNSMGELVAKQIRGVNYFTQLDETTFYKGLITEEKNKFLKEQEKKQTLESVIAEFNS